MHQVGIRCLSCGRSLSQRSGLFSALIKRTSSASVLATSSHKNIRSPERKRLFILVPALATGGSFARRARMVQDHPLQLRRHSTTHI
jgi:hypothetical protein